VYRLYSVMKSPHDILTAEWHTKNSKPFSAFTKGSHFRAWWKCSTCAHEWEATVANRVSRGSNCPNCRKIKARGKNNPKWTGYEEISGRLWLTYKKEAERKKIAFEITIEDAWDVLVEQDHKCALTGKTLGKRNVASLDLKEPDKGYVEGNIQWVDKRIHQVKRNLIDRDFISLCEEVASYQSKKKLAALAIPSFEEWSQKNH